MMSNSQAEFSRKRRDDRTNPKEIDRGRIALAAINAACKDDKDRKTGHIRNLHKWYAPMPLPAWRAACLHL